MRAPSQHDIERLTATLDQIRQSALCAPEAYQFELKHLDGEQLISATNLVHYLALRQIELRPLQKELTRLGLSSLGRCEAHVMASLEAVLRGLGFRAGRRDTLPSAAPVDFDDGETIVSKRAELLLGPQREERNARIMVTMPSSGASDRRLADELLSAGMDVVRINCAHDDADAWRQMLKNLRKAERKLGRRALVAFDLAGPKLRTGDQSDLDEKILLSPGDTLLLTKPDKLGKPQKTRKDGKKRPARMPCSLPQVFANLNPGERVWFDDGKIGGVIETVSQEEVSIRIRYALKHCERLRSDKGINLPDSQVELPCLTDKDLQDLDFVARHADIVSLSFIRAPEDVLDFYHELEARDALHLGVLLKIETPQAFEALPRILLSGLRFQKLGVMVARGDLAVEVGFARLSEVQEEILWLCEAAHIPVVWATQVLENLAKTGMPSRAEVTDAAMSGRAECVMLNKGPYIVDTVEFLSDVLARMQNHQTKKSALLRRLEVSEPPKQ